MKQIIAILLTIIFTCYPINVYAARDFESSSNDYIEVGNVSHLNLEGDQVTVSVWIKLESSSSEGKVLAKWSDASGAFQYLLSMNTSGQCQFAIYNSGTQIALGTTSYGLDTWLHVAGVYDGSDVLVYCNGSEEDSTSTTGDMSQTSAPVRIGAGSGGSGTEQPFDGEIAHCAIWDVGLSANEIQSLAEIQSLSAGINPRRIRGDNLLFYAPLNGQDPELDVVEGLSLTVNGPTVTEEPPISQSVVAPE